MSWKKNIRSCGRGMLILPVYLKLYRECFFEFGIERSEGILNDSGY
jgi:hypothetical protein